MKTYDIFESCFHCHNIRLVDTVRAKNGRNAIHNVADKQGLDWQDLKARLVTQSKGGQSAE